MRIRVLGPVELATANGEPTLPRWPRVRRLLAVLLVHAGEVVSVDRLGDALWGAATPADRTSAVHNLVPRLRGACGRPAQATRSGSSPARRATSSRSTPPPVDSIRFAGLVETARNRLDEAPQVAAAMLDEALALWHGPAGTVNLLGCRAAWAWLGAAEGDRSACVLPISVPSSLPGPRNPPRGWQGERSGGNNLRSRGMGVSTAVLEGGHGPPVVLARGVSYE